MSGSSFSERTGLRAYRYERPPYGEFGTLTKLGERLVCHLCGRDFRSLASHVSGPTHGMPVADYKEAFGLNRGASLWAASLRRVQGEKATARGFPERGRQEARAHPERWLLVSSVRKREMRPQERERLGALARANSRKANEAARVKGVLDWRSRLTQCKQGHEFTEANTFRFGPEKRWRACRRCRAEIMRIRRARGKRS